MSGWGKQAAYLCYGTKKAEPCGLAFEGWATRPEFAAMFLNFVFAGYWGRGDREGAVHGEVVGGEVVVGLPKLVPGDTLAGVGRFASEVCAGSAGGSGESRVRVRAEGVLADDARWVDLFDDLELALLEACDGGATVGDLLDAFATTPVFSSTTFTFGGPAEEEEEEGEASEAGEGEYKGAEVTEAEVLIRLYRLWDATLLEF